MLSLQSTPEQSARRILRRLRDVMAGVGTAQTRLNKIVSLIAAEMQADVCSTYAMRAGEVLELFATHGLKQQAVHKTRLRSGEGIVGTVAASMKPLALANAQTHPSFAYRPETGEDSYHSMMGVPITRGGKVRGVLTLQHKEMRQYRDDEIELMETIAMVVAEVVASGDLVSAAEMTSAGDPQLLPQRLDGLGLCGGMAAGAAVLHRPLLSFHEMVSDNIEGELTRLSQAFATMLADIDLLLQHPQAGLQGETREILETYRFFAADHSWKRRHEDAVKQGLTAEAAVQKVLNDYRVRLGAAGDPMIREKVADMEDLAARLIRHLGRSVFMPATIALPEETILIARSMGPADLLDYDRSKIKGLVLEQGTNASHVVLVARSLDIPVIGQCSGVIDKIEPLDPIIIDGKHGHIFIRPNEDVQTEFQNSFASKKQQKARLEELKLQPTCTADGIKIKLRLNCGLAFDFEQLQATGADGVGLYRTEIPFMVRGSFPNTAEQTTMYRQAFALCEGKPIIVRTLDVGSDKMLPYQTRQEEDNPALGWRAIRIGLDRPAMLRQQLRALFEAAEGRPFEVMFPMISTVAELLEAKAIFEMERAERRASGKPLADKIGVGLMMEVPALVWQIPAIIPHIDFLSVGSNDLLQYFFAADRTNPLISQRYDSLSPAFLLLIRELVVCCNTANIPLNVCGEMASKPLEAMALIGLGVRRLSLVPSGYGSIKTMLCSLNARALSDYLSSQLLKPDSSLRVKLRMYARDHGVILP